MDRGHVKIPMWRDNTLGCAVVPRAGRAAGAFIRDSPWALGGAARHVGRDRRLCVAGLTRCPLCFPPPCWPQLLQDVRVRSESSSAGCSLLRSRSAVAAAAAVAAAVPLPLPLPLRRRSSSRCRCRRSPHGSSCMVLILCRASSPPRPPCIPRPPRRPSPHQARVASPRPALHYPALPCLALPCLATCCSVSFSLDLPHLP